MLHAKTFRLLILFSVFSVSVAAQNFSEIHSKIRNLADNGNYTAAVAELQNLERSDKKVFALNNYDYLLARLAEKNNDAAQSAAYYQKVVNRNSVLSEYALWHLSQLARSSNNLILERTFLQQLLTTAPNSLPVTAAKIRLMRSDFESGNFQAVVSVQTKILDNQNSPLAAVIQSAQSQVANDARTHENLVYLGQAYLQLGKINDAREVFTRLTNNLPNPAQPDDFALAGARGLDELDGGRENLGKVPPQISDVEHYRRATIYQFNRDFADARLHFIALIEQFPQSSFAPDAMYQTGRGYIQEANFVEAIKWFERVQSSFPDNPISRDALNQTASAEARLKKFDEAISRYQTAIQKYPDADNPERPYLNIIDVERDAGNDADALRWIEKTRAAFEGKLPEALALFAQTKIHIAENNWVAALADLNELENFADLGGTKVPGGTDDTEITFLKGFVLEQLQRYAEAIDVYLSIPDGRAEYYGWRATERLRAMDSAEKSRPFVESKISDLRKVLSEQGMTNLGDFFNVKDKQSIFRLTSNTELQKSTLVWINQNYQWLANRADSSPYKIPTFKLIEFGRREVLKAKPEASTGYHQTLADELLFLGLYDEGAPELELSLKESGKINSSKPAADETSYTLAVFYRRVDMANRAVSFAEPLWKKVPADYQIELMPRDQIELLYPTPYSDSFSKYAAPRNVDPRFILSIMRQESRYRADVKSNAAARGLMQFISDTSNRIAGELGKSNLRQAELYNPPTAIEFGAQYLADLFKQFPVQPAAVAAAYNGGENNVARWLARAKSDEPDRYVPEIVFSQSKDYAYKVMANYRVYQIFYDERMNEK